jgi:ABC-2 type transport system permease protein
MSIVWANLWAIYRRELVGYMVSAWAYVIAAVFWFIAGFLFINILLGPTGVIAQGAFYDSQQAAGAPPQALDTAYELVKIFLGTMGSLSLFVLPMLSMGLYSEERKRGTLELLATSPVTNWAVAVGKLCAVITFFIGLSLPLMVYLATALSTATPGIAPIVLFTSYGALILLAAAVLSIGMVISSLTDSTIVAAIATFGVVLLLSLVDLVANVPGPIGAIMAQISLLKHYQDMIQGYVSTAALVAFASYIGLGVFLTAQSVEAFRFARS